MFENFDKLLLLAQGKIIYFNQAKYAVDYFTNIKVMDEYFKCPQLSNPADYFMSIMSKESMEYEDSENKEELEQALRERD